VKRERLSVQTKTSHFAEVVVTPSKKAVAGKPAPVYKPGKDGYDDWVILAVPGFKEYFDTDYRKLMDVFREMPRFAKSLGLTVETLPHFSTVCARKQAIPMRRWREITDGSLELYDLGDVQAIDATGVDRIQASQHYTKRTDYTFSAV